MSMRSTILFAILAVVVVGFNATAYRVQETEKAILLEFGNIVDADIKPGLHFKMPIRRNQASNYTRLPYLPS